MAVFRIEKTRDYTVMSNYHLRDMSLSLKAKGLLSLMLSLPENWDYTMKGLARICKDGIDSISGGIRELEAHGYLVRARIRGANGQLGSIEYTILEQPKAPSPTQEKPIRENPIQVKPMLDVPIQENPAQLNTKEQNKELSIRSFCIGLHLHAHRRDPPQRCCRSSFTWFCNWLFICFAFNDFIS